MPGLITMGKYPMIDLILFTMMLYFAYYLLLGAALVGLAWLVYVESGLRDRFDPYIIVHNHSKKTLVILSTSSPLSCPAGGMQRLRSSTLNRDSFVITDGIVNLTFYQDINTDIEHHGLVYRWKDGVLTIAD